MLPMLRTSRRPGRVWVTSKVNQATATIRSHAAGTAAIKRRPGQPRTGQGGQPHAIGRTPAQRRGCVATCVSRTVAGRGGAPSARRHDHTRAAGSRPKSPSQPWRRRARRCVDRRRLQRSDLAAGDRRIRRDPALPRRRAAAPAAAGRRGTWCPAPARSRPPRRRRTGGRCRSRSPGRARCPAPAPLVVKNGSKTRARVSASMPTPVSRTVSRT